MESAFSYDPKTRRNWSLVTGWSYVQLEGEDLEIPREGTQRRFRKTSLMTISLKPGIADRYEK
jgi:hypothetical protein